MAAFAYGELEQVEVMDVNGEAAATVDDGRMHMAMLVANSSKDPDTKVGTVVYSAEGACVATGFNKHPEGVADGALPWGKNADNALDNKYLYVVHSVQAALLHRTASVAGGALYTTLLPDAGGAALIAEAKLAKVVYMTERHGEQFTASRRIFDEAGIELSNVVPPAVTLDPALFS